MSFRSIVVKYQVEQFPVGAFMWNDLTPQPTLWSISTSAQAVMMFMKKLRGYVFHSSITLLGHYGCIDLFKQQGTTEPCSSYQINNSVHLTLKTQIPSTCIHTQTDVYMILSQLTPVSYGGGPLPQTQPTRA